MNPKLSVFVAGHQGLVGSTLVQQLQQKGYSNLVLRSRSELDLRDQAKVLGFFSQNKIDQVYLAAAKVGGIHANSTYPTEFLYDNLMISTNVIQSAAQTGVQKLLFLGSSCIYPKKAPQPIREESLLTGPLEPTNEAYALAKIAGLKLCEFYNRQYGKKFVSAMPTNLYGPGDNFDPMNSHVIPGLLRRFHEAKIAQSPRVVVWGSGHPLREFLFVDDLARALIQIMDSDCPSDLMNIGSGEEISIKDLATLIARVTGYAGEIVFDPSKPDGTPRKILDSSRIKALGWQPAVQLEKGLPETYAWALAEKKLIGGKK